jgi:predicted RNase H-like nuclease (RuvC/YqgF family)
MVLSFFPSFGWISGNTRALPWVLVLSKTLTEIKKPGYTVYIIYMNVVDEAERKVLIQDLKRLDAKKESLTKQLKETNQEIEKLEKKLKEMSRK